MILESVRVRNLRSIRDVGLQCDGLTALVGANGSGKSSFLKAIELFQAKNPDVKKEDYHGKNTNEDMVITLVFRDVFKHLRERLDDYIVDEKITIERVFRWNLDEDRPTSAFYGIRLKTSGFDEIREKLDGNANAKSIREIYDRLDRSYNLPDYTSRDKVASTLAEWEHRNPKLCKRARDDGDFFGIAGKKADIGEFARFIFVPAVHDALGDSQESKDSALGRIMEEITESMKADTRYRKFQDFVGREYDTMAQSFEAKVLKPLGNKITKNIERFIPNANVEISWDPRRQTLELPKAVAKLSEDEYVSTVDRAGHGSQRAFIMSMLQYLASEAGDADARDEAEPYTLVLAIEEPELYQHPSRQRHIARVLAELAGGGGAKKTQIIYTTHSPHFASMDGLSKIRLLRKIQLKQHRETSVVSADMETIKKDLRQYKRFEPNSVIPTDDILLTISTPWMNEGFFADKVVLVEGISDYAAITAAAKSKGPGFDGTGISVIPCDGKCSLYKPFVVFRNLGIPTYLVWDCDTDKPQNQTVNGRLLSLFGLTGTGKGEVTDKFACFTNNLNDTISEEIGPEYDELVREEAKRQWIPKENAKKKPSIINSVFAELGRQGKTSATLDAIVEKIRGLE